MIEVAGRPFLHWLTAYFAHEGLTDFVYSTGYEGDQIKAWCEDGSMPGLTRRIRHEQEPLGTGGGLLNCLDSCGAWVLVTNGDSLCLGGIPELLSLVGDHELAGGLIGVHTNDASRYGSLDVDGDGRLREFREKVPGEGYINGGTYLVRTDALASLQASSPCSIEHDLIPGLLDSGAQLQTVLVRDAPFIDIGTPETVVQADAFVRRHIERFAWQA